MPAWSSLPGVAKLPESLSALRVPISKYVFDYDECVYMH